MAARSTLTGVIPLRPGSGYEGPGIDLVDTSGRRVEWVGLPAYGDWELMEHVIASRGYTLPSREQARREGDHLIVVLVPAPEGTRRISRATPTAPSFEVLP